jgi:hypothetical protein
VTVAVVGTSVLPTGALTVAEPPAGEEVTVYEVMALPPLEAGAVHDTLAAALPAVATTPVGAPGAVAAPTGVTAFDGVDAGPVPAALEALTVKKYVVPFVNPVTVALVAGAATVAVSPPGLDVTVYEVTMLPPSTSGGVHDTVACALPATAVTRVGAAGGPIGVTGFDNAEAGPVAMSVVAVTLNEYVLPFTRPVTRPVVDVPGTITAPPGGLETTM